MLLTVDACQSCGELSARGWKVRVQFDMQGSGFVYHKLLTANQCSTPCPSAVWKDPGERSVNKLTK
ncbi:hypothetical protein GB937_006935 [Aspergillus fischeri]|nr:hypothetical protein GB937_006935 [Aspergillus fischeri]